MSGVLDTLVAAGEVDAGWARALAPVSANIDAVYALLREDVAIGAEFLPREENILRAFREPFDEVQVLIVGQDPYPTPGHAIGLSFAVEREVRPLPRSLSNIYTELEADLGVTRPPHGDLSAWSAQGVMLLNRVLTVAPGAAGSHRRRGWEQITAHAIRCLAARDAPLVAILWGKDAAEAAPLLGNTPIISSPHPSPLSARRGFFGSWPFSRANELLIGQGASPVDWGALASA